MPTEAAAEPAERRRDAPAAGRTPRAWQPITGGGLAAFASSGAWLALALQLLAAFACGASFARAVQRTWFPAVEAALANLPAADAGISGGRLHWPDATPRVLGATRQLSLAVAPEGKIPSQASDLQVELASDSVRVRGLAGFLGGPYPPGWGLDLDEIHGRAAWGAWSWVILSGLGCGVGAGLLLVWWSAALLAAPILSFVGWVARRQLTLGGAWRLAATAWTLPGAGLAFASTLYGNSLLSLPSFLACVGGHLAAGPLWILWAMLNLPPREARPANPFKTERGAKSSEEPGEAAGRPRATDKAP